LRTLQKILTFPEEKILLMKKGRKERPDGAFTAFF